MKENRDLMTKIEGKEKLIVAIYDYLAGTNWMEMSEASRKELILELIEGDFFSDEKIVDHTHSTYITVAHQYRI